MSRWRSESVYIGRYAGSGVLNTTAGFFIIFLLMGLGISPIVANVAGYMVGLILGFLLTKKLVFRSEGSFTSEGFRYLCVFFASFMLNLLTLQLVLEGLHWDKNFAQLIAAVIYTATMYCFSRLVVFKVGVAPLYKSSQK